MTIEQLMQLVALVSPTSTSPAPPRRQIVIGERGWVWVGDVRREGSDYILDNASCIRTWGTTAGLGELALKGKTPKTVLEPCGTLRIPELAVIGRIDVATGASL